MIDDGGPAFPLPVAVGPSGDVYCSADVSGGMGMSLRDYFAGQALMALVQRHGWQADTMARMAYEQADKMLAASQDAQPKEAQNG